MNIKIKLLFGLFFSVGLLNAQNTENFDMGFGENGKVITSLGQADFKIKSSKRQNDGRILLAGLINSYDKKTGLLMRVNADGSLDTSFNGTGRILFDNIPAIEKIIVLPTGEILVGGGVGVTRICKFLANGTPDITFGNNGVATSNTPAQNSFIEFVDFDLTLSNKIVVLSKSLGDFANQDYNLHRHLASGQVDQTFGQTNGFVTVNVSGRDEPKSLNVNVSQEIIVNGITHGQESKMFLCYHEENGLLNDGFGVSGRRYFDFGAKNLEEISPLLKNPNNFAIFAAHAKIGADTYAYLISLNEWSFPNSTIPNQGLNLIKIPNADGADKTTLSIDENLNYWFFTNTTAFNGNIPDKKIIAIKYDMFGTVHPDFITEDAFGNIHGKIINLSSNEDNLGDVVVNNNNIFLVGNTDFTPLDDRLYLAKLNNNGDLVTNFGNQGIQTYPISYPASSRCSKSVALPDGKIIVTGTEYINNGFRAFTLRYNTNGAIDTSFGIDGRVQLGFEEQNQEVIDTEVNINGKIIILLTRNFRNYLVQLNADGTKDTSFGNNGIMEFEGMFSTFRDLLILASGKIMIAGTEVPNPLLLTSSQYCLKRINANGTLDSTFGTNGTVYSQLPNTNSQVHRYIIELQSGKLLTYSTSEMPQGYRPVLFMYNADGTSDLSFNQQGYLFIGQAGTGFPAGLFQESNGMINICIKTTDNSYIVARIFEDGQFENTTIFGFTPDYYFEFCDFKRDSNGKLTIFGTASLSNANLNFFALRVNQNGSTDNSFGTNGLLEIDFNNNIDLLTSILMDDGSVTFVGTALTSNHLSHSAIALARFFPNEPLSISQLAKENNSFYPNPAAQSITLQETVTKAELFTIDGKSVVTKMNGNQIDVNQLPNGIYLVNLTFTNNETKTEKLVVKH